MFAINAARILPVPLHPRNVRDPRACAHMDATDSWRGSNGCRVSTGMSEAQNRSLASISASSARNSKARARSTIASGRLWNPAARSRAVSSEAPIRIEPFQGDASGTTSFRSVDASDSSVGEPEGKAQASANVASARIRWKVVSRIAAASFGTPGICLVRDSGASKMNRKYHRARLEASGDRSGQNMSPDRWEKARTFPTTGLHDHSKRATSDAGSVPGTRTRLAVATPSLQPRNGLWLGETASTTTGTPQKCGPE